MSKYIICGMQFGDEGKGTFVDYLTFNQSVGTLVRYNGGCQASHNVITPSGILHSFSQLSSGMFYPSSHTYLSSNTVINLDSLLVELEIFSSKVNIPQDVLLSRMHIHQNCYVVTPYHKLINKLRELASGKNRRGSVGTGVSEVMRLANEDSSLALRVKDIFCPNSHDNIYNVFLKLRKYVLAFYRKYNKEIVENTPDELRNSLSREISYLLLEQTLDKIVTEFSFKLFNLPFSPCLEQCIYDDEMLPTHKANVIFEGSQGLLLDKDYGTRPNTTLLDTTNHFAVNLLSASSDVKKIGIAKAFTSRHGMGIFPTEDKLLNQLITDENQTSLHWNGRIRFGWFDAVLMRYAQRINEVDELYLSCLDKLKGLEKIKVCNEYLYTGIIDDAFEETFDYYTSSSGQVIITDIQKSPHNFASYLESCMPLYITVQGWNIDLSNITKVRNLPSECKCYLNLLQNLVEIPITLVSVGKTRDEKIKR